MSNRQSGEVEMFTIRCRLFTITHQFEAGYLHLQSTTLSPQLIQSPPNCRFDRKRISFKRKLLTRFKMPFQSTAHALAFCYPTSWMPLICIHPQQWERENIRKFTISSHTSLVIYLRLGNGVKHGVRFASSPFA